MFYVCSLVTLLECMVNGGSLFLQTTSPVVLYTSKHLCIHDPLGLSRKGIVYMIVCVGIIQLQNLSIYICL